MDSVMRLIQNPLRTDRNKVFQRERYLLELREV